MDILRRVASRANILQGFGTSSAQSGFNQIATSNIQEKISMNRAGFCNLIGKGRIIPTVRNARRRGAQNFRAFSSKTGGTGGGGGDSKVLGGGGGGGGGGWAGALWAAYLRQLSDNPIVTKMWTSGLLNGIGDTVCQHFFEPDTPFDYRRLAIFSGLGLFLVGPTLHVWYGVLSSMFAGMTARSAVSSLLFDQAFFAPAFCAVFLSALLTVEGQAKDIPAKLRQDWWGTVVVNWKIWIPAQLFNFWMVPPNLRVLCANITALVWNTYLSFASHTEIKDDAEVGSKEKK